MPGSLQLASCTTTPLQRETTWYTGWNNWNRGYWKKSRDINSILARDGSSSLRSLYSGEKLFTRPYCSLNLRIPLEKEHSLFAHWLGPRSERDQQILHKTAQKEIMQKRKNLPVSRPDRGKKSGWGAIDMTLSRPNWNTRPQPLEEIFQSDNYLPW